MSSTVTSYATDEDIALRAPADFALLCPRDQKLAYGSDGAFLSNDLWTLTTGSTDASAPGLMPGQVVQLSKPVSFYKPPGDAFVIASIAPGSVTLRRKGLPPGVGQPPSPQGGLTGVEFLIATLGPQIEAASYGLNRRYGVDDLVAGRQTSALYDLREIRDATVLTVLYWQYLSMSRDVGEGRDAFSSKAGAFKQELDDLLARVVVHWGPSGQGAGMEPATLRFSTRLAR